MCALGGRAEADERPQVVAVIPLAADGGLAIYSKPTADALASRLTLANARVESLSLTGVTPSRVALVVDGRIARVGKGNVVIEARVRDPRRARVMVGTLTTDPAPLTRIDRLADALAKRLAPRLDTALTELAAVARAEAAARRQRKVIRLPTTVVRGEVPRPPVVVKATDRRPVMLVFRAAGEHTDSGLVTRHGYWLAERLGHRPLASRERGIPSLPAVKSALRKAGARYGLMMYVRDVTLDWRGVLTGRGRVRVIMVDGAGAVVFDRTARTGTLVGSRGEGPDALVHYIAEQVVEIVTPHLRRTMGASSGRRR